MDRLSALTISLAVLAACDKSGSTEPPPSRVNGAKTTKAQGATVEAFCDVHATAADAKPFSWPALVEPAPAAASTWRWINIWATWCRPCTEEMPRLVKWKPKLEAAGKKVDLQFVSVDESASDVADFRKDLKDAPATNRLADSKAQEQWFTQLGLTGSPPIPIHVFVDPQQKIRCVRSGCVRDVDYPIVEKLLRVVSLRRRRTAAT
jgi:thiol-disulfide isomerase/thioredoxin